MVLSFKNLKELISQGSKFTTHGQLRYFENFQCTELMKWKGNNWFTETEFQTGYYGERK